ncbi:MAG TPA: FHA domain-containing protein [Thermoanaerobaculia bacterium]|nr:FHA domain-containing protein [Thermoanaerobaculia bacterium]
MRAAFGEFTFDDETRQILRNGESVPVAPRVFDLLGVLLANRPRALSKSELMDTLWPKTFVSESNLASLVNDLRAALGDDARHATWIRTVYGFGYAFTGEGVPAAEAAPSFARHRLLWAGREVGLREGATVLGRDASADVLVVDGSVSRRHARIDVQGERVTLEDLGSKNGTFHGKERLTSPVTLLDGDEIRLGSVLLRFASASPDGSTRTHA